MLESVGKNCGSTVHAEVATKEFMEFMKDQAKVHLKSVYKDINWFIVKYTKHTHVIFQYMCSESNSSVNFFLFSFLYCGCATEGVTYNSNCAVVSHNSVNCIN